MKQLILLICVFSLLFNGHAQIGTTGNNNIPIPEDNWVCYQEEDPQFNPEMFNNSTFGKSFTPIGDIKVLVVFIEYENTLEPDPNPLPGWPEGGLPNVFDLNTGKLKFGYESTGEFGVVGSPSQDAHDNLSEFFYQMSNGQLRVLFESHKDNNGNPEVITVDPTGLNSYNQITTLAIEKIKTTYPNRNYSNLGFDIRTDSPNFIEDAQATFAQPQPNSEVDYVMVVHRDSDEFNAEYGGPFSPQASGFAGIPSDGIANNYTTNKGVTIAKYSGYYPRFLNIAVHEIMHNVINMPHVSLANDVHGRNFYASMLSGLMSYGNANSLSNAWERWYLGWTEITHDLNNSNDNGIYVLNDYLGTSESMRVKIPFVDEYVWLTYQKNNSNSFYNRTPPEFDIGGQLEQPLPQTGLYALMEKTAKSRSIMILSTSQQNVNTQKVMYGYGNYDYAIRAVSNEPGTWISLNQGRGNSYGGHHESIGFRYDNDDGQINHSYSGSGLGDNEYYNITKVNGVDKIHKTLDRSNLIDKKYSVFSNPSISNFQEISNFSVNKLEPIFLHSLSFTSKEVNGQIQIELNYDDGHIEEDFRMTGNVFLPSNEDIFLDKSITLTLDRSGTPNLRNDLSNVPNPIIDQFISPTVFIANDNSSFSIGKESTMIIDEGSTVIFEADSQLNLEQGGKIVIRGGSLLCLKTTDVNFANFTSRIIVEDGYLNVSSGININANVTSAANNFPYPTISNVINYCSYIQDIHLHSIDETNLGDPDCPFDLVLNSNTNVKMTSQNQLNIGPGFEVQDGASFDAYIQYNIPQECDIEFYFGADDIVPGGFWDGSPNGALDRNQHVFDFKINVYPNPSRDVFNTTIKNIQGLFTYRIRDFRGNIVDSKSSQNVEFSFDLSSYPNGIYFLTISQGESAETVKLLKM